jgi:hypothetical protein
MLFVAVIPVPASPSGGQSGIPPEADVWLDQYIIMDERGCKVYRNWFHDYSLESVTRVLKAAGFDIRRVWNDLAGSAYYEGGEWIALAAIKNRLV